MNPARQSSLARPEFDRLLAELQAPMRAYILSLLGGGSDVDDVLQETNLFLCERWTDFVPGTSFKAWAFRVAYFKTLACRRDRIRRDQVEFSESTLYRIAARSNELYGEGEDRLTALRHCLAGLSPDDRTLLSIRYTKGSSLTDYAKEKRKSVAAIHKTISRIRFALRHCVNTRLQRTQ